MLLLKNALDVSELGMRLNNSCSATKIEGTEDKSVVTDKFQQN